MEETKLERLKGNLQTAIELEHSTIPTYLCAMYTIKRGTNIEAYDVIRSVVIEEMLHLTLACNVLNAIGGEPFLNNPDFVAEYPTYLPHSNQAFEVHLRKFSPAAIETFLQIEKPAKPHAPPEGDKYHTIGQFYDAIRIDMEELEKEAQYNRRTIFTGSSDLQITPKYYYGGGEVIEVHDLESAKFAMHVIVEEGEGLPGHIFDEDHELFGEKPEVAHYFRFEEILRGQYFQKGDTPESGPTGGKMAVDWNTVYNMKTDPKVSDYPEGSELRAKAVAFNAAYFKFLSELHDAFNGSPELLIPATQHMFNLKNLALEMVKQPLPGHLGMNAGPTFELPR